MRKELMYHEAGLCVMPANIEEKRPTLSRWKCYKDRLPTRKHVETWFDNGHHGCCLMTGAVSGNLEMMDFDCGGEAYPAWCKVMDESAPGLRDKLVVERSPSGGYHIVYRCESPICGNMKLAQKSVAVTGDGPHVFHGKPYKSANGRVILTLIETRGEGGIFLCDPTPGYSLLQGSFESVPVLTTGERDAVLSAAHSFNEIFTQRVHAHKTTGEFRPGDDFNQRGDIRAVLVKHGWTLHRPGVNEQWCRPGKHGACSATLKDRVFYVFSTSVAPLESDRGYSPFSVYAMLEHGGDFTASALALRREGYGEIEAVSVDLSNFESKKKKNRVQDPGSVTVEMFRVPGFIGELMDFTIATAPYPNPAMAFCGALAMQSFLAGRKVRDSGDNRTNLYLLGLAHSGSGKDWARRVNTRLAHEIGLAACMGDHFASGEGIQDAMNATPAMLFQTDEIDGILQTLKKTKDAKHEAIMGTLLTMYSASASVFPMRKKAIQKGKVVDQNLAINQPSLTLFGTAIPTHYYEAISARMLTNGLFARMLVIEGGKRSEGQEPTVCDLPKHIVARAAWWADYKPGGSLHDLNPSPKTVEYTDSARKAITGFRIASDEEYAKAEHGCDSVGMALWSRVNEQARKLALIYAVSENPEAPAIGVKAVEWASNLSVTVAKRMLYMAEGHVTDSPFEAECLKMVAKLREAEAGRLVHSTILKRMKMSSRLFADVANTLIQRGDVELVESKTSGRPTREYVVLI